MKFTEFDISETTLKGLNFHGFEEATDIQRKTMPHLLKGDDVIGQAKTGSGKTLAFGIAILERLDEKLRKVQAVIITPTRELAKQVAEEISKAAKFTKFKIMTIYGGVSFDRQVRLLKGGAQIVAATPGRLLDHLRRGLKIYPKMIVLDEADKMFEMGFYEDVSYILKLIRGKYRQQYSFFGATIPDETISLAKKYAKNPVTVTIRKKHEERIPLSIEQIYYVISDSGDKLNTLIRILEDLNEKYQESKDRLKMLIFVKTRIGTKRLSQTLHQMGYEAEFISSDLKQATREKILADFQKYGRLLIATDVVARGIDIDDVTHVINYDRPQDIKDYVHRVGRTGRMGKEGMAITFITPEDEAFITAVEQIYKTEIKKQYFHRGRSRYNI
ncbi:MAG: DEAD/DEAH box helicase [Candidatus Helarchaeota archaeon]|nr:DEAD/DEAH box helicase [Candidatus Helarchaeota archaeon]